MTREEAIDKWIIPALKNTWNDKKCEEVLKALEQEPCEDAVSRKAVHDMLENLPITVEDKWFNWLQKACMRLADLPLVTPQPKTGHWIYKPMKGQFCSECDESCIWKFDYCPNCGAKMVEPQESEVEK